MINATCVCKSRHSSGLMVALPKHCSKNCPPRRGLVVGLPIAAATFRAIAMGLSLNPDANPALLAAPDNMAILLEMGADIPMCVLSTASRVQGIGEIVTPIRGVPRASGCSGQPTCCGANGSSLSRARDQREHADA